MHSSVRKICSVIAMLFLMLGLVNRASATTSTFNGFSWQTGDVIVCFGSGTCNVIRITGTGPVLLDQFSSGLSGATGGVGINNTLHLLVTDNGTGSVGTSNVVMYSIASVNPFTGTAIAHTAIKTFDATNGGASSNAQAIAISNNGHMFVANAGTGDTPTRTIVELDAHGVFVVGGSHTVPDSCIDSQLARIDLSADGLSVYLTSQGGTIQKFSLSGNTCAPFANLRLGARFDGIKDIPAGALGGVTPNCNGTTCPSGESILVVAKGFFDSNGDGSIDETHDNNICTDALNSPPVSCALLLKTGPPGLTASPWIANHHYFTTDITILDANLHVQKVATAGTSGTYATSPFHPAWKTDGTTTIDNAVTWTNQGPPLAWMPTTGFTAGQFILDSNSPQHVQQVFTGGTTGGSEPTACPSQPCTAGEWQDGTTPGGTTMDGSVVWIDRGVAAWQMDHPYNLTDAIFDGTNIQQVTTAGTSGHVQPTFNANVSQTTTDGLTWTDQGTSVVARYPVTGKSALQALTLDQFVTDCTGSSGTACNSSDGSFTPAPKIKNFWVGDFGSGDVFQVKFADGTFNNQFDANQVCSSPPCGVTSIQGIGIYGGESANQPGLAQLLAPTLISGTTNGEAVQFLQNNEVVSVYGLSGSVNLALYASAVDPTSCFNDQTPALSCRVTTSAANGSRPIVWKIDVPQGSTQSLGTSSSIAAKYTSSASGLVTGGIDNGTDVFTDMLYNTTVLVGNVDPSRTGTPSVQSLHEVPTTVTASQCAFSSPVSGACYKTSRTTLPFTIPQCPGLTQQQFANLGLLSNPSPPGGLSLLQTFGTSGAPNAINLNTSNNNGSTNRKASFRYDSTKNQWVYQLALSTLNGLTPGTFTGCAFDSTGTVQPFCVYDFKVQKSCP